MKLSILWCLEAALWEVMGGFPEADFWVPILLSL